MMKLRELEKKDATLMIEWMHDKSVVEYLNNNFSKMTIEDAEQFIESSHSDCHNIHLAIVSDDDEYMGTVSLKNIDVWSGIAEFGIAIRSCAMGYGYSWFGMRKVLAKAFDEFGLHNVFWCVSERNVRAIKFYEKHHFTPTVNVPRSILDKYNNVPNLRWYEVKRDISVCEW